MLTSLDGRWSGLLIESIRKSARTYASEISLWIAFCATINALPLGYSFPNPVPGNPPRFTGASEETALRFVGLFRNGRSAGKYFSAIRALHDLAGASPEGLDGRRVARALEGVRKLDPAPTHAVALRRSVVRQLANYAWARNENDTALQLVLGYTFGFRCGDELMPLCWDGLQTGGHSEVVTYANPDGRLVLRISLRSRKNEPKGAVLARPCTCAPWALDPQMCPVHSVQRWLNMQRRLKTGRFFFGLPATLLGSFQRRIRHLGERLHLSGWDGWTTQGLRRGMAQDMVASGSSLAQILLAGGWKSSAFLLYLERAEVAEDAILDCIFSQEDDAHDTALRRIPRAVRAVMQPPPNAEEFGFDVGQAPALLPAPAAKRPCVTPSQAPQRAIPVQAKPAAKAAALAKSVPAPRPTLPEQAKPASKAAAKDKSVPAPASTDKQRSILAYFEPRGLYSPPDSGL